MLLNILFTNCYMLLFVGELHCFW